MVVGDNNVEVGVCTLNFGCICLGIFLFVHSFINIHESLALGKKKKSTLQSGKDSSNTLTQFGHSTMNSSKGASSFIYLSGKYDSVCQGS